MMQRMQRLEPLSGHMGINLGGGNVGMSEQQLHDPQIGAMI